jgi:hypothetical protein
MIQVSGSIAVLMRIASRSRTGSHSQGLWLTNCCRHCSSPSASRAAIGSIDLRHPSSIRPRS